MNCEDKKNFHSADESTQQGKKEYCVRAPGVRCVCVACACHAGNIQMQTVRQAGRHARGKTILCAGVCVGVWRVRVRLRLPARAAGNA